MVSPPNHVFHYRDVGHGRQLWVMLFGRSPRQDGNKPFWGERLEVIVVNSAQRNACPGTSNLRRRLWCNSIAKGTSQDRFGFGKRLFTPVALPN